MEPRLTKAYRGEKNNLQQQHVCLQISGQLCFFSRFLKKCGLLEISFSASFMKDLNKHEIGTWKYLERRQQQQQREEESKANCSLLAGTGSLGMLGKSLTATLQDGLQCWLELFGGHPWSPLEGGQWQPVWGKCWKASWWRMPRAWWSLTWKVKGSNPSADKRLFSLCQRLFHSRSLALETMIVANERCKIECLSPE